MVVAMLGMEDGYVTRDNVGVSCLCGSMLGMISWKVDYVPCGYRISRKRVIFH